MDWDAKMPSWDLGTVVGPSVSGALDLKLGGPTSGKPVTATAAAALPPPSSSSSAAPAAPKRSRSGQLAQLQAAACSVEGCAADLSRCREYHRRHKVCEAHSKTPVVTVAGRQQRFCQQCSRFHLLGEFDEIKRSCRKRLDGHNRRRRKPQPDPLNPGGLFANHHGPGVTRFASYPQLFPAPSSMADSKWPATTIVKAETDAFHDHYYPSVHVNNGTAASLLFDGAHDRKRFPFLTPHGHDAAAGFDCQPSFTITTPSSESSAKQSNGNCALSLLSDNNPTPAPAPAQQLTIPTALPLGAELMQQYGNAARLPDPDDGDVVSLTGMSNYASPGGKQASVLATSGGPATQVQYHGGYYSYHASGGDGSAVQALPFSSW